MQILSLILLFIGGVSSTKFCKDCKFFLPDKSLYISSDYNNEFAKCSKYPQTTFNKNYLVTGKKDDPFIVYRYASTVRNDEDLCGKSGKAYKKKYTRKNSIPENE